MTDPIRQRLAAIDPMHAGVEVPTATDVSSRILLEEIMTIDTEQRPSTVRGTRRWLLPVAAATLLVAGIAGALTLDGASPDPAAVAGPPLELTAAGGDTMGSCIMFSVEELARAPLAFEGTVVAVSGSVVTLDVDRWFKGGDAAQVNLSAPQGMEALIAGFPFEAGTAYLITAYDGSVNYCGFSGPATPEFRAAFEQAFSG